ncbi:MAG TPA: efflux RND transporter periplasmic adaptor subunit [Devosiaceae bacterium]|nr:efflux RND transporter periplasmic adaptor subunit [Devosiaceae bacterium]
MKRIVSLVVLLALAAGFYLYAYPRLSGGERADAQQASTGNRRGGMAINVVSAVARTQTVPITKTDVGYIEAVNTVVLRSQADGVVVQQNVLEGQNVKTGDVLFKLDDSAIQATVAKDQAQIAKDQAATDLAEATLTRDKNLLSNQVVPQSTIDADVAAYKGAQAAVQVDNAQLKSDQVELSYMTIKAPITGRVGTINTSIGNVVHASDTSTGGMMTITQMSPLRVSFTVAESELDAFRTALAADQKLSVEVLAPGDKTPRATGVLSFIDSSVDSASGTIVLKADVDNSAGKLWPGQYVSAVTQLGAYKDATTVPLVAVQESSDGAYLFAIGKDEKVKKVPVAVVASVGDTAVIGNELKPGDHVVTEGQLQLSDGSLVRETIEGQTSGSTQGGNGGSSTNAASAAPASNT